MDSRKFFISVVCGLITVLVLLGMLTAVVDPYFHYHAPLDDLSYELDNDKERYINQGILEHFDYDAIIIGTSMTQNFKSSELDRLFGVNSVKTPFSGGMYKEINDRLTAALEANPNIKIVVRSLELENLLADKDSSNYDGYPEYLYDDRLLNDVKYVFNKEVLINGTFHTLKYTAEGNKTTDFDTYTNWMEGKTFGKAAVLSQYERNSEKSTEIRKFDDSDYDILKANIEQNVAALAKQYPETDFYLFLPPYSICWFDRANQNGELKCYFDAMRAEIELLLELNNVHLFGFYDDFDMICDLDNYKDEQHYGDWINSQILECMESGEHELTDDNYKEYCEKTEAYFLSYDYERLFLK